MRVTCSREAALPAGAFADVGTGTDPGADARATAYACAGWTEPAAGAAAVVTACATGPDLRLALLPALSTAVLMARMRVSSWFRNVRVVDCTSSAPPGWTL